MSDDQVLFLTREQLEAGAKSPKMKADAAKTHLVDIRLSEIVENIQTLSSQNLNQFETLKSELRRTDGPTNSPIDRPTDMISFRDYE